MKSLRSIPTLLMAAMLALTLAACGGQDSTAPIETPSFPNAPAQAPAPPESNERELDVSDSASDDSTLYLQVGDTVLTATLADNTSAEALKELLAEEPLTIQMSDYGNFEKVGSLGTSLPTNNEQITTEAGDLILYQGNSFVIYYDTNSWNFTRLGKIYDTSGTELKEILGEGGVTVTLSLTAE